MSTARKTRWLNADEQRTWGRLSTMILRLQPVLSAPLQREFGISHFEYLIMARLSEAPRSMLRMSVLATSSGGSLPRLSQAVARLEGHGWLSRQPDPEDRRYTLAVLTAEGRRRLEEIAPAHIETVRQFVFDRLTPNQSRQLGVICQRILDGLPPDSSWPSTASLQSTFVGPQ
jgi:DNA-binding MarR family transcriptional regulator